MFNPRGIVVCDIDGTALDNDIYERVRKAFCLPVHTPGEKDLSHRSYNQSFANWLTFPPGELQSYVSQNAVIREGLPEFYCSLRQEGISLVFASGGWDLYIKPALDQHIKIQFTQTIQEICDTIDDDDVVPVACNSVTYNGSSYDFKPHPIRNDVMAPDKLQIAWALREHYKVPIICIGDDKSDYDIARAADFVWATGRLTEYCQTQQIQHQYFNNFHDIRYSLQTTFNYIKAVRPGKGLGSYPPSAYGHA